MKKVCTVLLVLLVALTCCAAFSACDNTGIEIEGLSQEAIFVGLQQIGRDCDVKNTEENPLVIGKEKHTMKAMSLSNFVQRYGLGANAAQYTSLILRTGNGDKQIPLAIDSDQLVDKMYVACEFDGIKGMFLIRPNHADYKIAFSKIYFNDLRFLDFNLQEDKQNKKKNVKYVYSLENALRVAQFKIDMDKELAKPEDSRQQLFLNDYYARSSQSMAFQTLSDILMLNINPTDPMFLMGKDSVGLEVGFMRKNSVYAGSVFYTQNQKSSFQISDNQKFALSNLTYALVGETILGAFDVICDAVCASENSEYASLSKVMEFLGVDNERHIKPILYNTSKNVIEEGDYIYSQNLEDYTFRKSEGGAYKIYDELGNDKYDFVGFKYYY